MKGGFPVKKLIAKKKYDTQTAEIVKKCTYGVYGDPAGYEETLCRTPDGLYFVYVCGGEASPYPVEDILRMGKARVQTWLDEHK